ncbi:hypothetical protein LAZ67_10000742 [Cordylochernes scorpioides]|uniref:Uncharacterized protein n=1 Tax=Cordylochernes scorpioides TaxID=51811 RepID=A0ABY6KVA1_9ARAC|nr:hypothetical protein LAZ67_10000742 [Cordylochernes scorpioides]
MNDTSFNRIKQKATCISWFRAMAFLSIRYKRFKDGRKSIADDPRSGRPLTSTMDRNSGQQHGIIFKCFNNFWQMAEITTFPLISYKALGCKISLKLHFLYSNLELFLDNLGAVINEHGERFHKDISSMEKPYQGKWSPGMLADYCLTLKRDAPQARYRRKSTVTTFQ